MAKALAWGAVGLALSIAVTPPVLGEELGSCGVCHSLVKQAFLDSAHAQKGMICATCHGGNPADAQSTAMAPAAGFKGRPSRRQIPALCASCHSDPKRMQPYGLPTDQFAEYQLSRHGWALARGDARTAVCTDCHTTHHILPPDSPRSTVSPGNSPGTCARCHADEKRIAAYGLPADEYAEYVGSVHALALVEGGNPSAPSCVSCHGSHGPLPPGVQDIGHTCGQCHAQEQRALMKGPHGRPAAAGRMELCTSCHQGHGTQSAQPAMLTSACRACHGPGSSASMQGAALLGEIASAQKALATAGRALLRAEAAGWPVEDLPQRLRQAQGDLVQTAPAQHSMIPGDVQAHTARALQAAGVIARELAELARRERWRDLALAVLCAAVAVITGSLYLKRRRPRLPALEGGSEGAQR